MSAATGTVDGLTGGFSNAVADRETGQGSRVKPPGSFQGKTDNSYLELEKSNSQ